MIQGRGRETEVHERSSGVEVIKLGIKYTRECEKKWYIGTFHSLVFVRFFIWFCYFAKQFKYEKNISENPNISEKYRSIWEISKYLSWDIRGDRGKAGHRGKAGQCLYSKSRNITRDYSMRSCLFIVYYSSFVFLSEFCLHYNRESAIFNFEFFDVKSGESRIESCPF